MNFSEIPLIWDNDHDMTCSISRMVAFLWVHNGISEFLWVFSRYQIMFYFLNFPVEDLLILTYDLGSVDQAWWGHGGVGCR
jgi:hypothetical protein